MSNRLDELIKKIDEATKIEEIISNYIDIKIKGNNWWGVCPFHKDTEPSLSISPTKKIFKCFSCGAGGSSISFVQRYENISFIEALKKIANLYNIDSSAFINENVKKYSEEEKIIFKINQDALDFFVFQIENQKDKNQILKEYLIKRNLTPEIIEKYQIGYNFENKLYDLLLKKGYKIKELQDAKIINQQNAILKNRIIFPIIDEDGYIYGFSGRKIDDSFSGPKYINSQESLVFKKSEILWNINNVGYKEEAIILFEGFMDVISWETKSNSNIKAVASMGVAFGDKTLKKLKSRTSKIIIGFDKDYAGIENTIKIAYQALTLNLNVLVLVFDKFKDIDELLNNDQGNNFEYKNFFIWFIDEYLIKYLKISENTSYDSIPKKEINRFLKYYRDNSDEFNIVWNYFQKNIQIANLFDLDEKNKDNVSQKNKFESNKIKSETSDEKNSQTIKSQWIKLETKVMELNKISISLEKLLITLLKLSGNEEKIEKMIDDGNINKNTYNEIIKPLSSIELNFENLILLHPSEQSLFKLFFELNNKIDESNSQESISKNKKIFNDFVNEIILNIEEKLKLSKDEINRTKLLIDKKDVHDEELMEKYHKRIKKVS